MNSYENQSVHEKYIFVRIMGNKQNGIPIETDHLVTTTNSKEKGPPLKTPSISKKG